MIKGHLFVAAGSMVKRVLRRFAGSHRHEPFDPLFYASTYDDLAGADPEAHWRTRGRREGRIGALPDTHRPFDSDFYVGRYPDVAASGCHPCEHWVRYGRAEGRVGSPPTDLPPFDADYYLSCYADVGRSGLEPYRHWLRIGLPEGRIPVWSAAAQGTPPRLRDAITAAALFDRNYYLANYREDLGHGRDPLDYYIAIGQHQGHKPNATFDPLIYRLYHPEARERGSLLHYLERLRAGQSVDVDLSTRSAFPEVRHCGSLPNASNQPQDLKDRDFRDDLSQSEKFGQEQTLAFSIDGQEYCLVAPSADDFFGRLRDDRPTAFSRLPHGFWDCLFELSKVREHVVNVIASRSSSASYSDDEIDRLAERACSTVMPDMGVFEENFARELLGEIARDDSGADHLRSVSFKWQPTVDDRVFGITDVIDATERKQLRMFAKTFAPGRMVYESMVWKRWAYSGDIMRLIPEARERPVVLVGADRVKDLGRRWHLPLFTHLEIPLHSYDQRYAILDRCKEAVREAQAVAREHKTKKPLIMLQGGSFACWLIARLFNWEPNAVYLDFGQTLHIFFLENIDLWFHSPWINCHPRLIMDNCNLDEFYRDLGIKLHPMLRKPDDVVSLSS